MAIEAACQRLCYAFCTHGDTNDFERYEALFAPDARFSRPGRVLQSAREIGDVLRVRPTTTIVRHLCMDYRDEYVRLGSEWRFAARTVELSFGDPAPR